MAENEIGLKLKVDFDVDPKKINVVLAALKNSLGSLGGDIKPIDGDKIAAELRKIEVESKGVVTGIKSVDEALKTSGGSQGNLLKTAFTFNQIHQSVVGLTSALSPFIDEFVDLDANIKNIGTLGRKDFEDFTQITLKLAADIPGTAADMANGVYQAISAGAKGTAQEIGKFVEIAAKAGVAGLSDTTTAVNGLTSVLNAYGRSYDEANQVADTFFAGIKLGKTTFAEMNSALASFVPSASAMEVGFDQATAAIARLTAVGTPTAQAGTQMNAAFTLLAKGTGPLKDALKVVGTDLGELREKLKLPVKDGGGLVNVFRDIKNAANASGKQLAELAGSVEASKIIESLAGSNEKYLASIQTFNDVTSEIQGGAASKAFEIASTSIQAKADGFAASISGVFAGAFQAIGPNLTAGLSTLNKYGPAISGIVGGVAPLAKGFLNVGKSIAGIGGGLSAIVPGLAGVTGILPQAAVLFRAFWAAATGPIGLAIAGILAVGTVIYFLVDALHESAQEKLDSAKADEEVAKQQAALAQEQADNQQKRVSAAGNLSKEYERLGNISNRTAEEEKRFLEIQNQLIQAYPKAISGTNTFAENLKNLHGEIEKDKQKLMEYNEEVRKAKEQEALAKTNTAKAQLGVDVESFTDELKGGLNDLFNTGYEIRGNNKIVEGLKNDLLNASNDTELLKAKGKILEFVNNSDDLTPEEKAATIKKAQKVIDQQKAVIKAGQQELEVQYKNNLDRLNEQFKNKGVEFNVSDEQIQQIAKQSGKSVEEVTKAVGEMEKAARQSKVGEILGQSSKIQGDIKRVTRLDDLVKSFNEAKTEAEKAAIGDVIKKIAPEAIKATGVIEDANGKLNNTYEILGKNLDDVKKKQGEQYGGDLLAKQKEFVNVIGEEGDKYKKNRAELDKLKAEISEKKKLGVDTSEAEAKFKDLSDQNKKSIGEVVESTAKLASQGEVSNEVYAELGQKFGISGEEMKKMVESAKDLTKEIASTADRIADLGEAFKGALDGAKNAQSAGIAALAELERQRREGEITQAQYEIQRKDIVKNTKENIREAKNLTADQLKVERELGVAKDTSKKKSEDLYTILKKEFDLTGKSIDVEKDKQDLQAETLRIHQNREKTIADEIIAEERVTKALDDKKKKLEELFQITKDENGNVKIGVKIKDDQKESITQEYDKLLIDLNKSDNKSFELKAKITAKEESLDKLREDIRKNDLETKVKLAIDDKSKIEAIDNLKGYFQDQLTTIENDVNNTSAKITALKSNKVLNDAQRLELIDLENHLIELKKTDATLRENINSQDKAILDIKLADLKDHYDKEDQLLEESLKSRNDLSTHYLDLTNTIANKQFDAQLAKELDQLNKEQKLRESGLTLLANNEEEKAKLQDYYNEQKLAKQKEYADKKQALEFFKQGFELEQTRTGELEKLNLKKKRLEDEIALQEQINPGSKELQDLRDSLEVITNDINNKSDDFAVAKDVLSKGLSDSISAGFAGDSELMKSSLRQSLQISAGALKKKAEAAITSLIFGQLESISTLGIAGIFLLPVIKAVISAGVNSLLNPILTSITSFSTGGRVDSPTLAMVGDASNSRPGRDTEWILRDDQIRYLLDSATSSVVNRLVPSLVGMNAGLVSAVGKFTDMILTIGPTMAKNNISLYNVTNYFNEKVNANNLSYDTIADANTMKQLKKQNFQVRRFATGLAGGAITEPELILAGDSNIPEYVIRQDQLNNLVANIPQSNTLEKKLDDVITAIKGIYFQIDKEVIGQSVKKYNYEQNLRIKG